MPETTPADPEYQVLVGELREDGWTTRRVALRILEARADRTLTVAIRNPGFNAAYLRNTLQVSIDGEEVFSEMLFAGQKVTLSEPLPAGEEMLLEVDSEAFMVPDALDQRERGVLLTLTAE